MTLLDDRDHRPALFEADCGHRWIGSDAGDYACPVCGRHEGDHHLTAMEQLPVQRNGWPRWRQPYEELRGHPLDLWYCFACRRGGRLTELADHLAGCPEPQAVGLEASGLLRQAVRDDRGGGQAG